MVSNMNIEPRAEICDSNRPALTNSAVSQNTIECQINQQQQTNGMVDADELTKRVLKLDLTKRSQPEEGSFDSDEKATIDDIKSPKSPLANLSGRSGIGTRSTISHQSSITSQVEVVEDRKALRDALYQGIFHRHRRTIFAVGSFLRMLRSRNSQYNTIRSNSEGDEDTR
ncbi:uncharacterized protein LOC116349238 [Contarinia nasturtii]|uniref:uncharacterized protein LOC116349238 n=1 Tax=Contarinia nasturtii TaxID=265458 RepID=UPI0012D4798B|nr:uncharacterized protein LOC116349238 [Contarinia nasturtii]